MRLPLKISGDGIGPIMQFSFDTIDIENVFVNSQHSYEVMQVLVTVSLCLIYIWFPILEIVTSPTVSTPVMDWIKLIHSVITYQNLNSLD